MTNDVLVADLRGASGRLTGCKWQTYGVQVADLRGASGWALYLDFANDELVIDVKPSITNLSLYISY